ncbi:DinB family protein [Nocardioides KLBMP 9356]|uniref:DinB family protein n=1 Tax=Nocardioides potassii TaxID=2911371 RepID=A0ABS9H7V1_9ACTN|nr:DinB family protein [Nocardioides potassii]MCF6376554.1 DinB family protein [Nocardioides potassii]
MTIERTDPPYAADEAGMLRGFLDHYRATIRLQASGLTDEQLDQPLPPSDLTLGGMLKHLAFVEDYWLSYNLAGHDPAPPWDTAPWGEDADWDWHSAAGASHAELDGLLVEAIGRSDACLDAALAADPDLGRLVARPRDPAKGETATTRWVLVHMVEEYARHAGHADLIRQSIDGATDV